MEWFGITRGWVNKARFFIYEWTNPLRSFSTNKNVAAHTNKILTAHFPKGMFCSFAPECNKYKCMHIITSALALQRISWAALALGGQKLPCPVRHSYITHRLISINLCTTKHIRWSQSSAVSSKVLIICMLADSCPKPDRSERTLFCTATQIYLSLLGWNWILVTCQKQHSIWPTVYCLLLKKQKTELIMQWYTLTVCYIIVVCLFQQMASKYD